MSQKRRRVVNHRGVVMVKNLWTISWIVEMLIISDCLARESIRKMVGKQLIPTSLEDHVHVYWLYIHTNKSHPHTRTCMYVYIYIWYLPVLAKCSHVFLGSFSVHNMWHSNSLSILAASPRNLEKQFVFSGITMMFLTIIMPYVIIMCLYMYVYIYICIPISLYIYPNINI